MKKLQSFMSAKSADVRKIFSTAGTRFVFFKE